jgi:5-formyltetrahydrofolate cyclo-ligase
MRIIDEEKTALRKVFKNRRAALSAYDVKEKSQRINQNFIKNLLPKICKKNSEKVFSLYLHSGNEVTTSLIAQHFFEKQIKFSYPKIISKDHPLDFIQATKDMAFELNNFYPKILEPISGEKIFPDFIILPLLAFDSDLSRLGMGGGFFDRTINYLKSEKPEIFVIGLAYDIQRADDKLPKENTDQRLDFIVTEEKIFSAT